MKNMRKFIKQNIKGFIVGLIVTGVGIVTASTITPSNSVTYNNSSQNVTNVKEALDILLEKADNEAPTVSVSVSGKTATFTLKDDLGVIGYRVTTSAVEPTSWIDITSTTSIVKTWTASSAGTYYVHVKDKFGKTSNASFTIATSSFCAYPVGQTWTFDYTGGVQSLPITCSGTYKLEVWGAQGGKCSNYNGNCSIIKGGYSSGNTVLNEGNNIYIVVGGQGTSISFGQAAGSTLKGGYNGGGSGGSGNYYKGASGGGATHIAKVPGTLAEIGAANLKEILIVAGGAGGGAHSTDNFANYYNGGTGGGLTGGTGTGTYSGGTGGTQTSGAAFGQGTNCTGAATTQNGCAGGGGGLYGGGASTCRGGGGGSGYIKGLTDAQTANGVQAGNGKAVITLVSLS